MAPEAAGRPLPSPQTQARSRHPGTLARVQQVMVLGLCLLAAAWAVWAWPLGWLPALAGVLALLSLHALALALAMVLVRCTHENDPMPRASIAVLARAWGAELRTALQVFGWRQPFRSQCFPDHLPATSRGQRGVLLVHGYVCNRGLWNPWMLRLAAQGTPFVAVNLEPVFASIDDVVSGLEAGVQQLEAATGLPPVVVAHSMGGLVLRCWYAEASARGRLHRAITLGTPHQGTWLACWGPSRNARQMRPDSAWLRNLAAREAAVDPPPAEHFTCFHSHADNVVFPPRRATWPGADNRHLSGYAHVHMATAPEPWAELQRWLQAPGPGPG